MSDTDNWNMQHGTWDKLKLELSEGTSSIFEFRQMTGDGLAFRLRVEDSNSSRFEFKRGDGEWIALDYYQLHQAFKAAVQVLDSMVGLTPPS